MLALQPLLVNVTPPLDLPTITALAEAIAKIAHLSDLRTRPYMPPGWRRADRERPAGAAKVYREKVSGVRADRPQLARLIAFSSRMTWWS